MLLVLRQLHVHAMKRMFEDDECEAALLVDASNAFICDCTSQYLSAFSIILHNTYGTPVHLFVVGEGKTPPTEGTTQGDQFMDDATVVGSLSKLYMLSRCFFSWIRLCLFYKCYLIVKPESQPEPLPTALLILIYRLDVNIFLKNKTQEYMNMVNAKQKLNVPRAIYEAHLWESM